MKIGDREIGPWLPALVVAEPSYNHDGSILKALGLVHAAKEAGADAFKIPAIDPSCFTVPGLSEWRGEDQHAMFGRLALSREDIFTIAAECRKVGLIFLGTPDCAEHARWLVDAGASALKVGSDDLTSTPMLRELAAFGLPLILSTGMADMGDIDRAVKTLLPLDARYVFMHCTSRYPTPSQEANLRRITKLAARVPFVGFSDHTLSVEAGAIAVALGARVIEKHFTLSRSMEGPDHSFSADPLLFRYMVNNIREAEAMLGTGNVEPSEEEKAMRPIARRSIVAREPLLHGQFVTHESLAFKRPGTGLMPYEADKLLGKTLVRDVAKDEQIGLEDVA